MALRYVGLTGSNGMLGRHIRTDLEAYGLKVIPISRNKKEDDHTLSWDLNIWLSDIELDNLFTGAQAIIHAGAMVPRKNIDVNESLMFNINVRSCFNLGLWALSRNIPIIYISGGIVYKDNNNKKINEEMPLGPDISFGAYGLSKFYAEEVFKSLTNRGLKLSIIRASSIYGYGLDKDKLITLYLDRAKRGQNIEIFDPINDRINFIHAADVAFAVRKILELEAWEIFNIASKNNLSIYEIANSCIFVAKSGNLIIKNSENTNLKKLNIKFFLNADYAQKKLGWKESVSFEKGLDYMLKEKVLCLN